MLSKKTLAALATGLLVSTPVLAQDAFIPALMGPTGPVAGLQGMLATQSPAPLINGTVGSTALMRGNIPFAANQILNGLLANQSAEQIQAGVEYILDPTIPDILLAVFGPGGPGGPGIPGGGLPGLGGIPSVPGLGGLPALPGLGETPEVPGLPGGGGAAPDLASLLDPSALEQFTDLLDPDALPELPGGGGAPDLAGLLDPAALEDLMDMFDPDALPTIPGGDGAPALADLLDPSALEDLTGMLDPDALPGAGDLPMPGDIAP